MIGRAAQGIVVEVRRQFKEIKGLLEGKPGVEADYASCVDICTRSAQREMVYTRAETGTAYPEFYGYIVDGTGTTAVKKYSETVPEKGG